MPKDPFEYDENCIAYVELHERAWGQTRYKNRPRLQELLTANVVVFWMSIQNRDTHLTAAVYETVAGLNRHLSDLYLKSHVRPLNKTLYRVFIGQKPAAVKGQKLVLALEDDPAK